MPFLPTAEIINAVTESTTNYLELLTQQKVGVEIYDIHSIVVLQEDPYLLENTLWTACHGMLPQHLSIRSDSSATFIAQNEPGVEHEIRILEYDRRTGRTKLASLKSIPEKGKIVIDFRWLVRRTLEWFQQRGHAIHHIRAIVPNNMITFDESTFDSGFSDEQRLAVKTMLTSGLSYIWGPPGTGKTKWVLAKAVQYCVKQNKKVLVVASTNLAVDNALSAILEGPEGVSKQDVLRIGIASDPSFIEQYPECIEERAFNHEIRQIRSQIKMYEDNISSLQLSIHLGDETNRITKEIFAIKHQQEIQQQSLTVVCKNKDTTRNIVACSEVKLSTTESQVTAIRSQLGTYALPELLANIKVLEAEQTKCIKDITEKRHLIENFGFFSSLFTDKKTKLSNYIGYLEKHLLSIEETLESKRQERVRIAVIVSQLEEEIQKMESICTEERQRIARINNELFVIEQEHGDLQKNISLTHSMALQLDNQLQNIKEQTLQVKEIIPHTAENEQLIVEWGAGIVELEARLTQYKQDLSQKTVLGMTLDGFIGLTTQMGIAIDHVFIDEAPYAPLAKVLPLLSLNRPISMLGDLPPVCSIDNNDMVRSYWAKPAIYLEDAFRFGKRWTDLNNIEEPQCELTKRSTLTTSYRFGQSLATVLDRHIYGNIGLNGVGNGDTSIRCQHCDPQNVPTGIRRQNHSEVDAIIEKLKSWWQWALLQPMLPTIAILSPYKHQVRLIRQRLLQLDVVDAAIRDHVEVMNTHKAQGREWDCVLFSVSDTGNLQGNNPHYTDSKSSVGRAVLNTTISRTRKHLIIFLDKTYWSARQPPSLLTELAQKA